MTKENKKKSDARIMVTFIGMIAVSLLAGYLTGHFIGGMTKEGGGAADFAETVRFWKEMAEMAVPYVFVGLNVIMCLVSLVRLLSVRKRVQRLDMEDGEALDDIEARLNLLILVPNIMMILNFLFFSAMVQIIGFTKIKESPSEQVLFGILNITFFASFVWEICVQKYVVDTEKRLNPEKRGNILDTNFRREWEGSCDEAQLLMIYRSGYDAFKAASGTCIVLWVLSVIAQLFFHTGVFPGVMITVIWLVLVITYHVSCVRQEQGSGENTM